MKKQGLEAVLASARGSLRDFVASGLTISSVSVCSGPHRNCVVRFI